MKCFFKSLFIFKPFLFLKKPYRGQGLQHKHAKTTTHFITAVSIWEICLLFPFFHYISSFLSYALKTALLSSNHIQ